MSIGYKRAIGTSIIFGVLYIFLIVYFGIIGPVNFLDSTFNKMICVVFMVISAISLVLLTILTKSKNDFIDERDELVDKKSIYLGLFITIIYVFIFCIVVTFSYKSVGVIDVSWMFFVALSTYAFGFFITGLLKVIYYSVLN